MQRAAHREHTSRIYFFGGVVPHETVKVVAHGNPCLLIKFYSSPLMSSLKDME